jgi:pimeloyl-ACP methyl ester carboxylesterase
MSAEQQIGYCTTADGVRIAFASYGNEDAQPLVYIPDLPGQEAIWASPRGRLFMQELARHRRLVTLDFRGEGASERGLDRSNPESLLADVTAVVDPEPLRHLLTGKSYVYADRGKTMLKGFEDAVRLYEVRWRDEVA